MKELYSKTSQAVNRENYIQLQRKNGIFKNSKPIKTKARRKTEIQEENNAYDRISSIYQTEILLLYSNG